MSEGKSKVDLQSCRECPYLKTENCPRWGENPPPESADNKYDACAPVVALYRKERPSMGEMVEYRVRFGEIRDLFGELEDDEGIWGEDATVPYLQKNLRLLQAMFEEDEKSQEIFARIGGLV